MSLEVDFFRGFMFGFEVIDFAPGEVDGDPDGGTYIVVDVGFIRFVLAPRD